MGDSFKIKPLARYNTAYPGTHGLGFRRHHHPAHNHDETGYLRTKLAHSGQQEMDHASRRDPIEGSSQSSTQPMSRKGSLQVEGGLPMNLEREKRISQAQQDEVSNTVRGLQFTGEQHMLRLTRTCSSVSQKLNEIRMMGEQLKTLGKAAEEVLQEFDIGDINIRKEYAAQIKGIERFQEELVSIQKLQERLGAEKRKVQAYRERLERVQGRIDKQKEMEIAWRQRASRRLRLLWGFISVLVILWLLATASNDRPSESTDLQVVKADHSSSPPTLQYQGNSREF